MVLPHAIFGRVVPHTSRTLNTATTAAAAATTQVFLSQIHRRAHLLNAPFQQLVAAAVGRGPESSSPSSAPRGGEPLADTGRDPPDQPAPQGPSSQDGPGRPAAPASPACRVSLHRPSGEVPAARRSSVDGSPVRVQWSRGAGAESAEGRHAERAAWVEVHPAAVKTKARMREKLTK